MKIPIRTKSKLALVIPAHNEEKVIEATIKSVIAAGLEANDIYVVDDASSDMTVRKSRRLLGHDQVLKVKRSGKAGAIEKAIKHFDLLKKYGWVHIADADGIFDTSYFVNLKNKLNGRKFVAATGHVQSQKGPWVSQYRTYEYTIGLEIIRRIQSLFGTITVIPGASAVYRSDIIPKLDFHTHSLTEDFDLTVQIHRHKLGKIQYIPQARAKTQDPKDYQDYVKQIQRWYRGFWQGVRRYKLGRRLGKIDLYLNVIMLDAFLYASQLFIWLPIMAFINLNFVKLFFVLDVIYFLCLIIASAAFNRRWDILQAFPLFYVLRLTNVAIFSWAFVEVIILRRFRQIPVGWETSGRRYKMQTN